MLLSEPVIGLDLENKPDQIVNSEHSTSHVLKLPTITTQNGPFR